MAKKLLQHKIVITVIVVVMVALGVYGVWQVRMLHKAHSTFDNYYQFRGCTQLIARTPTYGTCKTASGKTITIVLYHGKWYLQGDLPNGILGHLL